MKTSLIVLSALLVPVSLGAASSMPDTYSVPGANPGWTSSRWNLSAMALYAFNAAPDSEFADDMAGLEVEGAWQMTTHQALTISLHGIGTSHDHRYWVESQGHYFPYERGFDRSDFALMVGYRITVPVVKRVSFQASVKGGVDIQYLGVDDNYGHSHYWDERTYDDTAFGFAYAASAGLTFEVTPQVSIVAAYQYMGSTAKPSIRHSFPEGRSYVGKSMRWHAVKAGVHIRF